MTCCISSIQAHMHSRSLLVQLCSKALYWNHFHEEVSQGTNLGCLLVVLIITILQTESNSYKFVDETSATLTLDQILYSRSPENSWCNVPVETPRQQENNTTQISLILISLKQGKHKTHTNRHKIHSARNRGKHSWHYNHQHPHM